MAHPNSEKLGRGDRMKEVEKLEKSGTHWMRALRLSTPVLLLMVSVLPAMAADPGGAKTLAENPEAPVDFVWTLVCGFLVMFMQAGFAMLEAGFARAKNVANVMMKNLMDFAIGSLAFFAIGFALMMGTDLHGLIGTDGWFLVGNAYDVSTIEIWFFMLVFCATAATIVSGAIAERPKFSIYMIYSAVVSAISIQYTVIGCGVVDG